MNTYTMLAISMQRRKTALTAILRYDMIVPMHRADEPDFS